MSWWTQTDSLLSFVAVDQWTSFYLSKAAWADAWADDEMYFLEPYLFYGTRVV